MRLQEIRELVATTGQHFAFNEITGELKYALQGDDWSTALIGDSRDESYLVELLFDDEEISKAWNLVSDEKGTLMYFAEANRILLANLRGETTCPLLPILSKGH